MDKCVKRLGMGITSGKAAKAVENQRARKLYEEIFDEDSPAFVDYYFRVKAAENEIFVVENEKQEILATLHLNPYEMMFCDERVKTNYIVAVATRADWSSSGHDAFAFTGFPSGNVPERRDVYLADAGRRSHLSSVWLSIYL